MAQTARWEGPPGEVLLAAALLTAVQLARGRSEAEIELLSAFFDVLADNLGLIAARRSMPDGNEVIEP